MKVISNRCNMEKYLNLCRDILNYGIYKPAAREGMPGTKSVFGTQLCFDLQNGFPLLTTKEMFFKGIVIELIWFLRGDVNIKFLIDNGVNIWNDDAYNYYRKIWQKNYPDEPPFPKEEFLAIIRRSNKDELFTAVRDYNYGDCGFQYGKVWRNFGQYVSEPDSEGMSYGSTGEDQIRSVLKSLINTPESRRHLVTAIDPVNQDDLALYWCHALFQFNCRPLTTEQRNSIMAKQNQIYVSGHGGLEKWLDDVKAPKYFLDCQLYQRSADTFLGVPFNIASYALLTHIFAKICNMVPGYFIHTFGDVHIYENHFEQVKTQISREPYDSPTLEINPDLEELFNTVRSNPDSLDDLFFSLSVNDFVLKDYNCHSKIRGELSTGTGK